MKTKNEKTEYSEASGHQKKETAVIPGNDHEWRENERFRQEVQKVFRAYTGDVLKPDRPLDLSFLPEEVAAMLREAETQKPAEIRKIPSDAYGSSSQEKKTTGTLEGRSGNRARSSRRISQWAAAILLCIVVTTGMTCWMNSQCAHAARFHLEKMLYQMSGNYYVSDPEEDGGTDVIEIRIDDPQDLDRASRFMPELLTPESVQEGWQFAGLTLSKNLQGEKHAVYNYTGPESRSFWIEESFPAEEASLVPELSETRQTTLHGGRSLYLFPDAGTGAHTEAAFVENRVAVRIRGDLEEEQLLEVAEHLRTGGAER